ncbi:MAG: TetR/AcrR family transcriptional regulator [Silicimonas sp.]|nr:TetR/AcrR family transcriptional regulator [Silicimonas sp.]
MTQALPQSDKTPKTKRGKERRAQILAAAEEVIGTLGYASASIVEITRAARTAPGTFYVYFDGKEQVFRELVEEMGNITRSVVAEAVADAPDRLSAERAGLSAFLRFSVERPTLYRIVEEARFVDIEAYRAYFTRFGEGYQAHLDAALASGEISEGDSEVRAWVLMGIAKSLGERMVLWEDAPDHDRVVDAAFALIENGLKP